MQQVYVWCIVSLYIFEISFIYIFVSHVFCAVLLVMAAICDSKQHIRKVLAATIDDDPSNEARQQTNTITCDV